MPRPPVRPEDRQRVARACQTCKASKKRCDGIRPCGSCSRKGLGEICRYVPGRRGSSYKARRPAVSGNNRAGGEDVCDNADGPDLTSSPSAVWGSYCESNPEVTRVLPNSNPSRDANGEDGVGGDDAGLDSSNDTRSSSQQPALMLSSSSGEGVFIGDTAAISFLRFLQHTLKRHAGPSDFTDDQDTQRLFEAADPDAVPPAFQDDLTFQDKEELIVCFLDVSSGLLDLFSSAELNKLLKLSTEPIYSDRNQRTARKRPREALSASLYLMIAIGAQCRGKSSVDGATAAKYFAQARKMAFDDMLQDPTLDLTRAFLLMAFYMLGACRRNSAFMYIGVASKAADILGLHIEAQHRHLKPDIREARMRTSQTLRVLDVVCNSILGRRSSVVPFGASPEAQRRARQEETPHGHRSTAQTAIYDLSSVLDAAVTKSTEGGLDARSAEVFLRALRQRSREFPPSLRRGPRDLESCERGVAVGNIHVAGAYYFAVILITRRFLIRQVMPQLRGTSCGGGADHGPDHGLVSELSRACVEAATYMAQNFRQAMDCGLLLGNMCIIKAWIFAAGLVLGFSLLVEETQDAADTTERRDAFGSSLHILGELRRLSPQAGQYFGILANFRDAIEQYRQRLLQEKKAEASRGSLVDRIFSPPHPQQQQQQQQEDLPGFSQMPTPEMTILDDEIATWLGEGSLPFGGVGDGQQQWMMSGDQDVIMRLVWDG
ncbi:hypothetical protein PpBr36_04239 [Pyricularia pennisetigena]|uniref:hypothetical protein n=1 Tax=Pyricularia pennisetigena TaxID=1578925 RepID=UPI00115095CA|nr:hypothetical protein PpBr36_04239 [Pyricularia pennisetigena]TLS27423.1 hypothetical protein PpBr36_04239 [Pyricularia pennisetigena]